MTNLSIAENQRGIENAQSVTRLTEIGFAFIPLTFAASLFSMQVYELNPDDTSVKDFVIVAVVLLFMLYALRLFIRSRRFKAARQSVRNSIRLHGRVKPSQSIPNTLVLGWSWEKLFIAAITTPLNRLAGLVAPPMKMLTGLIEGKISTSSLFSSTVALISTFTPLWTSSLAKSIKIAITIAMCLPLTWVALFYAFWIIKRRRGHQ